MNLDPRCWRSSSARRCHGLARADARRGAGVHRLRPGLPGPRRHPGAAGRRGPQARLTDRGAAPWRPGSTRPGWTTRGAGDGRPPRCATLAEAGARVRREAGRPRPATAEAVAPRSRRRPVRGRWSPPGPTPGCCVRCSSRGARCRSWPGPTRACPAGPGALDLVVMLAPEGSDHGSASAVAEAVRRGCQVVVACPPSARSSPSTPPAAGRDGAADRRRATSSRPPCVVLEYLDQRRPRSARRRRVGGRGPRPGRRDCSPHRDLAVNPAKMLAIAMADTNPLVWGGSVLAARAARRVAESMRRASGRSAIAGDAEHLLPVIEAAPAARPVRRPVRRRARRPASVLLVLDDGADDPVVREQRGRLEAAAARHGVRVERSRPTPTPRSRATPRCCSAAPTPRSTSASASSSD